MGIGQVIFRTVITTIDLLLAIATICAKDVAFSHKKFFVALVLVNIAGVWL